jgi:hypothetical protein
MILQVLLDSVIVEQRIIYIDEKDDGITACFHRCDLQIHRSRPNWSVSRGAEAPWYKASQPAKRDELTFVNPDKYV